MPSGEKRAILTGEDGFFEIGVRQGNSTGAFTILTPRQPLTAVPLAMRADTANNAVRAALADKLDNVAANQYVKTDDAWLSEARKTIAGSGNYIQNTITQQTNANFNISGSGTIGGNLTIGGTITNSCRSGFTVIPNGRLCVSAMQPPTFYGAIGAT